MFSLLSFSMGFLVPSANAPATAANGSEGWGISGIMSASLTPSTKSTSIPASCCEDCCVGLICSDTAWEMFDAARSRPMPRRLLTTGEDGRYWIPGEDGSSLSGEAGEVGPVAFT